MNVRREVEFVVGVLYVHASCSGERLKAPEHLVILLQFLRCKASANTSTDNDGGNVTAFDDGRAGFSRGFGHARPRVLAGSPR